MPNSDTTKSHVSLLSKEDIGTRLVTLQKQKGYKSVKAVIEKANSEIKKAGSNDELNPITAQKHFSGSNPPGIDYLYAYSIVFKVSMEYILTGDNIQKEDVDENNIEVEDAFSALKVFLEFFNESINFIDVKQSIVYYNSIDYKENEKQYIAKAICVNDLIVNSFLEKYQQLTQLYEKAENESFGKEMFEIGMSGFIEKAIQNWHNMLDAAEYYTEITQGK